MFDWDCLAKSVQVDSADIVVHFTKQRDPYRYRLAGIALYDLGYVRVTQADWASVEGGYEQAFITLIHELGHVFGAFHVFRDLKYKAHCVMNPRLSDKLLVKKGLETVVQVPDWHPGNQVLIRALKQRPFRASEWKQEHWPDIEHAYRTVRQEYCGFRVDERGRLTGHDEDELYEPDYYAFVATWAAQCGMDSCALMYIDSMAVVLEAMKNTCLDCGTSCQAHVCWYTGFHDWRIERWFDHRLAYYHLDKAHLLVSAGSMEEAEAEFDAFLKLERNMSVTDKQRYRAAFDYYRARSRTDPEPEEDNGGHE
jgi:hypothetical protein